VGPVSVGTGGDLAFTFPTGVLSQVDFQMPDSSCYVDIAATFGPWASSDLWLDWESTNNTVGNFRYSDTRAADFGDYNCTGWYEDYEAVADSGHLVEFELGIGVGCLIFGFGWLYRSVRKVGGTDF